MTEWDRLVLCCSNGLPVTVSVKLIDGTFELCFCCIDSPSMEVINLPCCKASVHRHCVLKPFKATINVFTAGNFWILKILLIALLNPRHCQERQTFPKLLHLQNERHHQRQTRQERRTYHKQLHFQNLRHRKRRTCPRKIYLPT